MNIRNVLRVYAGLRQLTDDETALLETLRGMSDAEHEAMVVALAPQKATKKPAKKVASKSRRASGMAAALGRSLESQRRVTEPLCTTCGNVEDYVDHYEPSPSYHPFALPARSAASSSSPRNAFTEDGGSHTQSSATGKDAAGDAALGASGGD